MKRKFVVIFSVMLLLCASVLGLVACKHNHEWNEAWENDATYHWHNCNKKGCDEEGNKEEHSFALKTDLNNHWQQCSVCGYSKDVVKHNFNSNNDYICDDCGFQHQHKIVYDDADHQYACDNCDINKDKSAHTFNDKDTCAFCGFIKGTIGLEFALNSDNNSYTITGVNREEENIPSDIVIPEYYKGKPVTIIGENTFSGRESMTSVIIPKSVESIKDGAFFGCHGLLEVVIPDSVKYIAEGAFENCYGITIKAQAKSKPSGWETIEWRVQTSYYPVVWDCENNNIAEDGYIYFVENGVKYGLKNNQLKIAKQSPLKENFNLSPTVEFNGVNYPVTEIGEYAFYKNSNLKDIRVTNYVTKIGKYAFNDCNQLSNITWVLKGAVEGDKKIGVEEIGICAFAGCTSLNVAGINNPTQFELPNTLKSISAGMFQDCSSLQQITISSNIEYVGDSAFVGCSKLIIKCVTAQKPPIWSNLWNEDNRPVIWNCNSNNSTEDGYIFVQISSAFYGLNKVNKTAILISQELENYPELLFVSNSVDYDGVTYQVTEIGENAFANNKQIKTITIMATNIKKIGAGAFLGCVALENINFIGSESDWNAVEKGSNWILGAGIDNNNNGEINYIYNYQG